MKNSQLFLLVCFAVCTLLNIVNAEQGTFYDALRDELPTKGRDNVGEHGMGLDRDEELFEVAYRFIQQLTETRKSLAALKDVLSYLDEDLKHKSEVLEERYVKGKDLWNLLKAAVQSESSAEQHPGGATNTKGLKKRMCRVNLGGHCQTENAASLASQMHFLSSGLSPGKRRRRNVAMVAAAANGGSVANASGKKVSASRIVKTENTEQ